MSDDKGPRFGTDGIRGRAGEWPCTSEVGVAVGRAAVRLARTVGGSRVCIARDPRESGPMLEAAIAAGVAGEGGTALLAGVLPTSGLACALRAGIADVGVMLTASHNPHTDNGFKVLGPGGRKLSDDETAAVERWLGEAPGTREPGTIRDAQAEAFEAYAAALSAAIPERTKLAGRRLAVDLANGAALPMRDWLLQELPCEVVFASDGTGRVNDGCGSEHPERLQEIVVSERCDAGLAVDGDGDRCRLVTEHGRIVDGDALAWLLARARGTRALAVTVMSNAALEPSLADVRVVRTPVGDRHLAEAIARGEATLGVEESGHVVFDDALPTGDGVVTGLRALSWALATAGSVAEAVAPFRPFPRKVTKVRVAQRPPLEEVEALQAARREHERQLGRGGRVFLRYSGTEPVLRILVEGEDEGAVARASAEVTRVATESLA